MLNTFSSLENQIDSLRHENLLLKIEVKRLESKNYSLLDNIDSLENKNYSLSHKLKKLSPSKHFLEEHNSYKIQPKDQISTLLL